MSCLYSSPGLSLSWSLRHFTRSGTRDAHRIAAQFNSTQILPYVAVSKDAFPSSPAYAAGCIKLFSLPKQAQVSRVSFQAQYQAFVRFAVGSSAALNSHRASVGPAFWNLSLGAGSLALRTLAFTRSIYGASNPGPMLWAERSRSRGIFQVIFCISIGLYEGNFRPPTARAVPARSAFGGRSSINPAAIIKRSTSAL